MTFGDWSAEGREVLRRVLMKATKRETTMSAAPWDRTEWESRIRGRVLELRAQMWLGRDSGRDSWGFVVEVVEFRPSLGAGPRVLAEGVAPTRQEAEAMAEDEARRWFEGLAEHGWWGAA